MKIVVFGLTISSSWGNGHATLWRGLCKALTDLGAHVVFFERNQSWYSNHRDRLSMPGGELVIYEAWRTVAARADAELADADAAITTSYCPDALLAQAAMLSAGRPLTVFYDLDTPVTLERFEAGERVPYVGESGLRDYDLVLSYTGGAAIEELRCALGARRVRPLYGHVDPDVHRPMSPSPSYTSDLSWLGTYAEDRREAMDRLFIRPAIRAPHFKFLVGGAQYPPEFPWGPNIWFVHHVPPSEHAAFFCSSRLTLNITRAAMAKKGWCPSGRLFEAAACGAAQVSDEWSGIEDFYTPGEEILIARTCEDVLAALELDARALARVGAAARERTLTEHTSTHRARQLLQFLHETRAVRAASGASEHAVGETRS